MGASCVSSTRAKFHHPRLPSGRWIPPITTTTRPIEPSQINWTPPSTRNQGLRHPMNAVPSSRKQRPHLSRGKFYGGRRIKRPPVSANNTPKYATKSCGSVCHAFKSDALSSQRTRAGAIAHQVQSASLQFNPRRNRNHRNNAKFQKLHSDLMHAVVPSAYAHLCWSYEKLDNFTLVFDGGNHDTPELQEPPPSPPIKKSAKSAPTSKKHHTTLSKHRLWKSLRISRGDLHVADTIDPSKGITYPNLDGKSPFVRVPRRASLEITQMESMEESNKFCIALKYGFNCQRGSLHRGEARKIYCDHKYCCMGVQPNRAAPGVNDATYHRDSMPEGMWDLIVEKMKLTENALSSYVSTDVVNVNVVTYLHGKETRLDALSHNSCTISCFRLSSSCVMSSLLLTTYTSLSNNELCDIWKSQLGAAFGYSDISPTQKYIETFYYLDVISFNNVDLGAF